MTETEWQDCDNHETMLWFLEGKTNARKLRQFCLACLRSYWSALTSDRIRDFVEAMEDDASGLLSWADVSMGVYSPTVGTVYHKPLPDSPPFVSVGSKVTPTTVVCLIEAMKVFNDITADCTGIVAEISVRNSALVEYDQRLFRVVPIVEMEQRPFHGQASLVRDIFGNPFRPVAFDPAWRSCDVTALGQAAYRERVLPSGELDPVRLSVLADALEEAGAAQEITAHLRAPGPHVRGCWALDLCLGDP